MSTMEDLIHGNRLPPDSPWKNSFKKAEELTKDCQQLMIENAQNRSGVTSQILRSRLTRLDRTLDGLDVHIERMLSNPQSMGVTAKEANAQSNNVKELRQQLLEMQEQLRIQPTASDALNLGGQASKFDMRQELLSGMEHEQVIQYQDQVIQGQDGMLNDIEASVNTLRDVTRNVNQEIDVQNRMLDETSMAVEHNQDRTEHEHRRLEAITITNSVKKLWCLISVLTGSLLVLVLTWKR